MQSSKEEQRPVAPVTGDHDALFAGLPLIGGGESLGSAVTQALASHQASRQPSGQQRSIIQASGNLQSAALLGLRALPMALQPPISQQGSTPQSAAMSVNQSGGGIPTNTQAIATVTAAAAVAASSQFQRLKVEDALSYLDQVKLQFGNQPQVYNDFLDIMKEFKSQSIDTPGVISRVSNLFKGHPDLIVGFNTFLPPGFKIEVHHNEINISGPAQHSHALQKIAQQHNSANNAALASQSSGASSTSQTKGAQGASTPTSGQTQGGSTTSAHQPVEFNHAINYVNKIKNRFQHHPDIYKAFLEILHTYQKEQRAIKEGGTPSTIPLSETEVYSQVSKLFQNQEDLLSEFGQFLPDATAQFSLSPLGPPPPKKSALSGSGKGSKPTHGRKGSQSGGNSSQGQSKKPKSTAKDVLAEAGKHTNYAELALFDKIRKALRNQEVHENFLRCLVLFNEEIISRQELVHLVTPFLGKYPELFGSFKTLLGFKDPGLPEQLPTNASLPPYPPKERVTEFAAEIDFNSLKRHGASYRALPKTYVQPKCSGRTQLCREVLNDTWVSFPMWSEDSTFQGTRKTQYEEYIFRCEDERFELDVVLENNLSTIRYFEALQKKMTKMSPEEVSRFTLDNALGGVSEVLQRKAIHRIYGDKAPDIIEGLRKSPSVAVPVVLKRLKSKQEEWIDAQRAFNKQWRDQLEKYYLKSLDHQGITFKATDTRAMRSKSLIGEIETTFDERQEQLSEGASTAGPHLQFMFLEDHCVFSDAVGLVMYYMKRASSLQREDATKIRSFLTHTLADFCFYPRVEVSSEDDLSPESDSEAMEVDLLPQESDRPGLMKNIGGALVPEAMPQFSAMDYHVIFTNNALYTFFRLFQFLCERLNRIYQQSLLTVEEEEREKKEKGGTIAVQLGFKRPPDIRVEEHYPTFLNMAKNFMEGNIDSTTYEDTCREMFGVHAFVVFTIDRLVQNTVRQLHTIVADNGCYHIMEQYSAYVEQLTPSHTHMEGRAALEVTYQRKVEGILGDDNCFKIVFNKKSHKMTFELLDTEESSDENNCPEMRKWQSYVEKYSKPEEEASPELREILANRKVFLKRNRRTWLHTASNGEEDEAKLVRIHLPEMEIFGAIEFKMDKKSYRMIPLANSEDYLYNKQSLKKANEVNVSVQERKRKGFRKWLSQWLQSSVSQAEQQTCRNWLMGEQEEGVRSSQCRPETFLGCERNRYITVTTTTT